MKIAFFCTLTMFLFTTGSLAQIGLPNGSFEQWTGTLPDHWKTSNLPGGGANNVYRIDQAYQGDYALKGEVMVYPYTPGFPLIPYLESKTDEGIFQVSEQVPAVNMYYKFHPANEGDVLKVYASIQGEGGSVLGSGFIEIDKEADEFKLLSIPLNYYADLPPVQVYVHLTIDHNGTGDLPSIGSYFVVDEISLGDVVSSVDDPDFPEIDMGKIYPNPTSSDLHIPFSMSKQQGVNVDIFDLSGRRVLEGSSETLSSGDHTLSVNLDQLPEGMYICRLSTFRGSVSRKVLLSRR